MYIDQMTTLRRNCQGKPRGSNHGGQRYKERSGMTQQSLYLRSKKKESISTSLSKKVGVNIIEVMFAPHGLC